MLVPGVMCVFMKKAISFRCIGSQVITRVQNLSSCKPFTVFVEGNIGSGKSTFINHFIGSDAHVLSEPVDLWRNVKGHNFLELLYKDPSRWGLALQSYVQLTMMDLHLRPSSHSVKIMERSIYSSRYCFIENLARSQIISDAEYTVLDEWFKWITSHMDIGGNLIVYLQTKPEVVYERIKARGRKEEECIPLEYLKRLNDLHEDWLYHRTHFICPAPVLVLDGNNNLSDMKKEFCRVKSLILQEKNA